MGNGINTVGAKVKIGENIVPDKLNGLLVYMGPSFVGHTFLLYQKNPDGTLNLSNVHALKINTQRATGSGPFNDIQGTWMDVKSPPSLKQMHGTVSSHAGHISITCYWQAGSTQPALKGTITEVSPNFHLDGTAPFGMVAGDG